MLRKAIMFAALLALIGCSPTGPYSKKDGKWLFEREAVPVPAGEKLTPLNRRFAKSETLAFFRATPIEGADPASFEALTEHYAKDRAHVWWGDTYRKGQEYYLIVYTRITPIQGADPASFEALRMDYAKDKARVYFEGRPFAADAPTFELLDYGFARDTVSGYFHREPIPGSDGKTFTFIDHEWSKDAGRVFWSDVDLSSQPAGAIVNRLAEGADPRTFQALENGYGKDAAHVYYQGKLVEGADPATFTVAAGANEADARDKTRSYRAGGPATPLPPPEPEQPPQIVDENGDPAPGDQP